jgi:siroheme synthase
LMAAGLRGDTPCAIVSRASSREEQIHRTSVEELPAAPLLPAPTMLLVGEAIGVGDRADEVPELQILSAGLILPPPAGALGDDMENQVVRVD